MAIRSLQGNHFNPLPRKEGDDNPVQVVDLACGISIHSLVKRETPVPCHL